MGKRVLGLSNHAILEMKYYYLISIGGLVPRFFRKYCLSILNNYNDINNKQVFLEQNSYLINKNISILHKYYLEPKNDLIRIILDLKYYWWENDPFLEYLADYKPNCDRDSPEVIKGIRKKWLLERFNIKGLQKSNIRFNSLPLHGWLATFPDSGYAGTDDSFLLEHASFFLYKAKKLLEIIEKFEDKYYMQKHKIDKKNVSIKPFIRLYAMESLINIFSFIESFVNNTAFHFIEDRRLHNTPYNPLLEKYLSENQKSFISTEKKLSTYPIAIREERDNFKEEELKYLENKFPDFLRFKKIRDTIVHYSENPDTKTPKLSVWVKPDSWLIKSDECFRLILEITRDFLNRCGSNESPEYLYYLDYNQLMKVGEKLYKQELSTFRFFTAKPKPIIINMRSKKRYYS